jgi:hypothetical protein
MEQIQVDRAGIHNMDSCTKKVRLDGYRENRHDEHIPMTDETSARFHRDPARRLALASDAGLPGAGMALALPMSLVLQACSAAPPAHATTPVPAASGPAAPGDDSPEPPGRAHGGAGSPGDGGAPAPIVRISLGWYPPEHEDEVAALLDYKRRSIGEDIERLPGLLWYYSGIDRERHAIVNVSAWRDAPSAEQMGKLQAMLALGGDMARLGVQFVRPITNFEPIWTVTGAAP